MKALWIIAVIILTPVALFEYFVLFWFWGGDGTFTFFATPIAFGIYLWLQIQISKKYESVAAKNICKFSMVLVTPMLAAFTVWCLAKILGIDITIA